MSLSSKQISSLSSLPPSQDESSPSVIVRPESPTKKPKITSNQTALNSINQHKLSEPNAMMQTASIEIEKEPNHNSLIKLEKARQERGKVSVGKIQNEKDKDNLNQLSTSSSLTLSELPDIFREFSLLTDEWISIDADMDGLEEQIAELSLFTNHSEDLEDQGNKDEGVGAKKQKRMKVEQLLENFTLIYELKTRKQQALYRLFEQSELQQVQTIFDQRNSLSNPAVVHPHIPEKLSFSNLQTLSGCNWLNDEVVNAYVRLIAKDTTESVVILNSFFYPELLKKSPLSKLKRILSKNKVGYQSGIVLVPMNIGGNHWTFAEINNDKGLVIYYDSLANHSTDLSHVAAPFAELFQALQTEDNILPAKQKRYEVVMGITGVQQNGFDCGVFMLQGIYLRSKFIEGLRYWLDQSQTSYFRYLITYQLLIGRISSSTVE